MVARFIASTVNASLAADYASIVLVGRTVRQHALFRLKCCSFGRYSWAFDPEPGLNILTEHPERQCLSHHVGRLGLWFHTWKAYNTNPRLD